MRGVVDGGPWTFENHLLVLLELKAEEELKEVLLHYALFWVQVYDLPKCFFSEVISKALANYIGSFVHYDKKNVKYVERPYMRIRVQLDIRQPLKKGKKVKRTGIRLD